jgi:hypothetical protein
MTDFGPTQFRRGSDDDVNEMIRGLRAERDEARGALDRMIEAYNEFVERTRTQAAGANELVDQLEAERDAERALCDKVMDVLSRMVVGWEHIIGADLAQHPDVVAVAAEWRAARGR